MLVVRLILSQAGQGGSVRKVDLVCSGRVVWGVLLVVWHVGRVVWCAGHGGGGWLVGLVGGVGWRGWLTIDRLIDDDDGWTMARYFFKYF